MMKSCPTLLLRQVAAAPVLERAWRKVRANRGAAGIDAVSLRAFEKDLGRNIAELSRNLLAHTYEPLPARFVKILKANGKERELGILTVRDRVAQRAVLDAIEPLFEQKFLDCSYAFRPGRSVEMAVQRIVLARARGFRWTVEADIANFFPSLDRRLLMREIESEMSDADVLRLIAQWFEASIETDAEVPTVSALARSAALFRQAVNTVRDTAWGILDEWVNERYGEAYYATAEINGNSFDGTPASEEVIGLQDEFAEPSAPAQRKAAWRKVLRDGLLLTVAERALLRKFLTPQLLGLGGVAIAAAVVGPTVVRAFQERGMKLQGALQGAPISPLLSNAYLHPFDERMTLVGFRLVRYCDDFVLLCRTEEEAQRALNEAQLSLTERRLRLHPEKTRILPPSEEFDFLGYRFTPHGGARRIQTRAESITRASTTAAREKLRQATTHLATKKEKTRLGAAKIFDKASAWLRRERRT